MPAPATARARRRPNTKRPNSQRPNTRRPAAKPSAVSELEALLDAAQRTPAPAATTFADLGLSKSLVMALEKKGVTAPFAIQARAIPDVLAGRDVLGRAQTG